MAVAIIVGRMTSLLPHYIQVLLITALVKILPWHYVQVVGRCFSSEPFLVFTILFIRFSTSTVCVSDAGTILLNILLTSATPVSRQGTNNVSLMCVPNATQNYGGKSDGKAPVCMLIRVKTAEMADELFSQISKSKE